MQRSALCRSRRELSNEYLLAKIGVDTAENEPCKVCPPSAYRSPRWLHLEDDRYPTRNIHEKVARFLDNGFDHFRDNFFFEDGVIKAWTLKVKLRDTPGYLEVQPLVAIYDDFAVEMAALAPGRGVRSGERGRLSLNCWWTVGGLSVNCRWTVGELSVDCR